MSRNIFDTKGQDSAGNWQKPVIDFGGLRAKGYFGLYILAHKVVNAGGWRFDDNKFMGDTIDDANASKFSVGRYIDPDPTHMSYARALIDLASKVGVQNDKQLPSDSTDALPPCVMVTHWPSPQTVHQMEEDFFSYFNSILLSRYTNVVLALNLATVNAISVAIASGSTKIRDTIALPSVRIWYIRPGLTPDEMNKELLASPMKKSVWIAGTAIGMSILDWYPPVNPPTPDPEPETGLTEKQQIAKLLREMANVLDPLKGS